MYPHDASTLTGSRRRKRAIREATGHNTPKSKLSGHAAGSIHMRGVVGILVCHQWSVRRLDTTRHVT